MRSGLVGTDARSAAPGARRPRAAQMGRGRWVDLVHAGRIIAGAAHAHRVMTHGARGMGCCVPGAGARQLSPDRHHAVCDAEPA
jgi:hypothetical protein